MNLDLRVLGKRDDGYHELCTKFQTVSLADQLSFSGSSEISMTCNTPTVPVDSSNLIIKAAEILKQRYGIKDGATVHLEKLIPSPGGLGGGSSDCAVALMGFARLWGIRLSIAELVDMGTQLGSDVPFFFYGGTAIGTGRGTAIQDCAQFEEKHMLIVTPDVDVSTAAAFKLLDAPRLTKSRAKRILKLCCQEGQTSDSQQKQPVNDFERVVFDLEPEIRRVKEKLIECGANQVMLSGSGASVFGIFENEETRQATLKALQDEENWRMFAVATVSRNNYREALKNVLDVVSD
jgi:4-diphosphocytidyl-2-C-methyl-D-erythritol kinase